MRSLAFLCVSAALMASASLSQQPVVDVPSVSAEAFAGITVTGTGEVAMKPDTLIIRGEFSVNADQAGDALTKYRDGRRRALKMLESLGVQSLTIAGPGPTISVSPGFGDRAANMRQMMGMDGSIDAEPKVRIHETLTIRIGGISELDPAADVIAKVLDKAKEAGIKVGTNEDMREYMGWSFGNPLDTRMDQGVPIAYLVSDQAKVEEAAFAKAMEEARRRADMLARLAGRRIGRVLRISHDDFQPEKHAFDGLFRVRLRVSFALEG